MSAGTDQECSSCGAAHGPDDIFCESCGYDFITGSLPSAEEIQRLGLSLPAPAGPDPVAATPDDPGSGSGPVTAAVLVHVEVAADRAYFDAVVSEGELSFPDPAPESRHLELAGPEIHIGRASQSRAIHPDVDLASLTGDPAVSSRHAVLRVADDGSITITDVGSTNGTIIGTVDAPPTGPGTTTVLEPGTSVYLGAWTRLTVAKPAP